MESNWTVCGVCDSLEITKPSDVWCSECDEGLCTECDKHHAVSKASRTHSTLPITEYSKLPSIVLDITHNCSKHNEKYQTYCRKHDCPCCHRCVIETHNDCKNIIAIDDIIKDVKSSSALYDIELMLEEVVENLEKITKDREKNVYSVMDQKKKIEIDIQQKRLKINRHLDQIQENLMKDLTTKEEKERKKLQELLTALEKKRKEIDEYRRTIANIKQHASDLQTFLAIKEMENKVTVEGRFLETLAKSDSVKQISMSLRDDELFHNISHFKFIGQIEVEMRPTEVVMTRMKGKQAQLQVSSSSQRLIKDIKLTLKQTINTGLSLTKGCLILPDGRFVLSCRSDNLVRFFKRDGNKDFTISLKPINVIDITFIPQDNTIAVTSGRESINTISIIDIKNRKVSKQIRAKFSYYGIVFNESWLITCVEDEGLHILKNGSTEVFEEIKTKNMSSFPYIATFDNKLYYTNNIQHSVTCCDMKGTDIWKFEDNSVLKYPQGVTVDNDGNVYVAGAFSNNVIIISSDGKQFFELLSEKDGLRFPIVLDYDRSTNQLLVGNESETALLFQVI